MSFQPLSSVCGRPWGGRDRLGEPVAAGFPGAPYSASQAPSKATPARNPRRGVELRSSDLSLRLQPVVEISSIRRPSRKKDLVSAHGDLIVTHPRRCSALSPRFTLLWAQRFFPRPCRLGPPHVPSHETFSSSRTVRPSLISKAILRGHHRTNNLSGERHRGVAGIEGAPGSSERPIEPVHFVCSALDLRAPLEVSGTTSVEGDSAPVSAKCAGVRITQATTGP